MYGAALRHARTDRGMTQGELAAASGIAQANISAIENGRRHPSASTLHRLLAGCGYDLVAAAGDRRIPFIAPPAPGEPPIVSELIAAAQDPEARKRVPAVGPDTPYRERSRRLIAALDAAEATIRRRDR